MAANARNCDEPAKTKTGWVNKAKETAADTGKPAKDLSDATFAANCARRASTKISWANKVKAIAVGIARLAEDASSDEVIWSRSGAQLPDAANISREAHREDEGGISRTSKLQGHNEAALIGISMVTQGPGIRHCCVEPEGRSL